ncbi:bifunctional diguanylate cyclase/phosphodiesterase [Bacillus tuaregi]|uniref:bifunctional diguanylate cyclase/phosphodiesterase n=1 Tax=Bacillus tuaregi TaxID=1816695 RepID=UPI0008F95B48|nr:EAL domain-containing protein [Bacillus tuaregi]
MRNIKYIFQSSKDTRFIILASAVFLMVALWFREPFYGIFGENNYLTIHLIMEFFIITISFTIAIQSWMAFPHVLSNYRLWIGAMFFSVGLIEIAHAITFKGMPFFLSESSAYKATWFFMAARLTEVVGLLAIVTSKDRLVCSSKRFLAYGISFFYALTWIVIVFYPTPLLPELVREGIGTTSIKNNLQYAGMILEVFIIYFVIVRSRSQEFFNLMLIMASLYFMTSDYFFTTYKSVYDINNFIGHLFQIAGMYFMQRAVYHTSVEEPFQKQKESEERLKQNKQFLETITSHMGEGLIVTDTSGHVTFINLEAQQLLQWTKDEVQGKNIYSLIQQNEEHSLGVCSFTDSKSCRVERDVFTRKDGTTFPTGYVITPLLEDGKVNGNIMVFRDITQQEKDQRLIHHMAFYDELTQLPNFRFLKDALSDIILSKPDTKTAVLELDIDRFKNINEALGHSFGDSILQGVTERLQQVMSENMILGRMTGDQYGLILTSIAEEDEVIHLIQHIQDTLKEPLDAQNLLLNVSIKIGVSIYPDHGMNCDLLFKHANVALIEAKQQNSAYQFYRTSMEGRAMERLIFENDLFHALENKELSLVYQPQVDIQSGDIIGLEALIRWQHPTQGWISPGKFIPIAEDTGLIVPIGEWVLRTACQQMKVWHDEGFPPLAIGVNLSIRQFYQDDLVEMVKGVLAETELAPEYLDLEITESMMMNADYAMRKLKELKEVGVQISIDDFGTGYSSLSYLKHLPVDRLKIDQSFVRDIVHNPEKADTAVVSTIIALANNLNLNVIAEGVETDIQKEFLQSSQCQQLQGYLFSPPLFPEEFSLKYESLKKQQGEVLVFPS